MSEIQNIINPILGEIKSFFNENDEPDFNACKKYIYSQFENSDLPVEEVLKKSVAGFLAFELGEYNKDKIKSVLEDKNGIFSKTITPYKEFFEFLRETKSDPFAITTFAYELSKIGANFREPKNWITRESVRKTYSVNRIAQLVKELATENPEVNISIDFDNTLTVAQFNTDEHNVIPNIYLINKIKELKHKFPDIKLKILTTRTEQGVPQIKDFLATNFSDMGDIQIDYDPNNSTVQTGDARHFHKISRFLDQANNLSEEKIVHIDDSPYNNSFDAKPENSYWCQLSNSNLDDKQQNYQVDLGKEIFDKWSQFKETRQAL
jgi:hypothetical protein